MSNYDQTVKQIENLSRNFKAIRRMRKESLRTVSKKTGISFSLLCDFENNKKNLGADNMIRMFRWMDHIQSPKKSSQG